ncbi:EAL domain-containing protein (plasmid) [Sinorhizobium chiapasense]|uniref:putative bifunctional diguanylate cyclase/phosphodiesterase n=1 Tax=Sinorhizobium chiapasense TaxID=501572 RepID=UPI002FE0EA98
MKETQPTSAGQFVHFDDEIEVILNAIPQPVIIKDGLSRFCFLNDAACALVGRERGELTGRTDHDILPTAEADRIREIDKQVLSSGRELLFEEEITIADGTVRSLVTQKRRAELIRGNSKEVVVVATILDVTARRKALEALKESEARFRAIADHAPVMIWVTDESGADTYHSRLWLEMTGQTPEEAQGFGWVNAIHPEDREEVEGGFQAAFRLRQPVRVECRLRRTDGSWAWVIDVGQPRFASDGAFLGYVGIVLDITERRNAEEERLRAQKQVHHMARHDALTGLPNRQFVREAFDHLMDKCTGTAEAAVLSLDLDGFKTVNDAYGHAVGDLLLRRVADRLRQCVEQTDIIARLGGVEFLVVRPGMHRSEDVLRLARRIIDSVGVPYDLEGTHADIGVNIGLAFAPRDGQSADELIKAADIALYRAKSNGRGSYAQFEPGMDTHLQARQKMKIALRRALANGELEVHYQPLIKVHTGQITSCEALVRWTDPEKGPVSPAEFIPIAEETGLIDPLGEWILRQACTEAAKWPPHVSVAVNLSPLQFRDRRLATTIADILRETGLNASRLQLEITESVLLDESEGNLLVLQQIRQLGTKIAMDDFGTGYSSLRYLRTFPFDKIKVDRSFVSDLPTGKESLAIIRAVAAIGRALGITTTVEGVDTQAQFDLIRAEGFDEVQGYLVARPLPAKQVLGVIERRSRKAQMETYERLHHAKSNEGTPFIQPTK